MAVTHAVRSVLPVAATLGEGPVWVDGALWFVDIKQQQVHRFDPATGEAQSWKAPAQVGWILPYAEGGFLAGLQTGVHRFDPETGSFTHVAAVEPALPGNRLNDATVDPAGRLWFGSMDDGEEAPTGHIYHASERGIARVASGIAITNGPAVSPDGRTLYHHDTLGGLVFASTIGDGGALSDTRVLARIAPEDGHPDGPTVDADGHIWVGLYGGWGVRRYSPTGELVDFVRLPVANVTKIAFGGDDLSTAYATTAAKGLSDAERAAQPLAGHLFAFDPGVAGLPAVPAAAFSAERLYD
jgi:D-xylonolactonase